MKLSKYNVYVPLNDSRHVAIYNTWRGRYCVLPKAVAQSLKCQQQRSDVARQFVKLLDRSRELATAGILIPDDVCEDARFQEKHERAKFSFDCLKVVAILTMKCNLRCHYCYQSAEGMTGASMTPDIAHALVRFMGNQIERTQVKALSLGLYGGEPLLVPNIGSILVEGVRQLTAGKDIYAEISMTTNGYRLNELRDWPVVRKVSSVHLTLDGNRVIHDSVRCTPRGGPSYTRILEGIRMLVAAKKKTIIRIHSNRFDAERLTEVLNDLMSVGLGPTSDATLYLMQLEDCGAHSARGCGIRNFQAVEEQYHHIMSLITDVQAHPLAPLIYREFHLPTFSLPVRAIACEHESVVAFTVNWDGSVMICPRLGGDDRIVGRILADGQIEHNRRHEQIMGDVRHENAACHLCEFLPVCGGPCLLKAKPRQLADCHESRALYQSLVARYVSNAEAVGGSAPSKAALSVDGVG